MFKVNVKCLAECKRNNIQPQTTGSAPPANDFELVDDRSNLVELGFNHFYLKCVCIYLH